MTQRQERDILPLVGHYIVCLFLSHVHPLFTSAPRESVWREQTVIKGKEIYGLFSICQLFQS